MTNDWQTEHFDICDPEVIFKFWFGHRGKTAGETRGVKKKKPNASGNIVAHFYGACCLCFSVSIPFARLTMQNWTPNYQTNRAK